MPWGKVTQIFKASSSIWLLLDMEQRSSALAGAWLGGSGVAVLRNVV